MIGRSFHRLTVVEEAGRARNGERLWNCKCACGSSVVVRGGDIRSGHTQSCGCLQRERTVEACTTHGGKGTRLYLIWKGMRRRCNSPTDHLYALYGGRGIAVCVEWNESFEVFRDWAFANGYRDDLTIDRKDNDGAYEPSNCRWVTMTVQSRNRRNVKLDEAKAAAIRNDSRAHRLIAADYGTSPGYVSRIKLGKVWATEGQKNG